VVDVVKDVLVVYVYVVLQYVGEVKTVLTVSMMVELAVAALIVATAGVAVEATTATVEFVMVGDVVIVFIVVEVVTAYVTE